MLEAYSELHSTRMLRFDGFVLLRVWGCILRDERLPALHSLFVLAVPFHLAALLGPVRYVYWTQPYRPSPSCALPRAFGLIAPKLQSNFSTSWLCLLISEERTKPTSGESDEQQVLELCAREFKARG